jgi:hypothetical protein
VIVTGAPEEGLEFVLCVCASNVICAKLEPPRLKRTKMKNQKFESVPIWESTFLAVTG